MSRISKRKYSKLIEGEKAELMYADEMATQVSRRISLVGYLLLELRRLLFSNPFTEPGYYLLRHMYSQTDRFLLDNLMLGVTYDNAKNGERINVISRLRYKYYYLCYWSRYHRLLGEWSRISTASEKPVYALTSEIKAYIPDFGKATLSFWLPKPAETN